jgi:hypothetical protein
MEAVLHANTEVVLDINTANTNTGTKIGRFRENSQMFTFVSAFPKLLSTSVHMLITVFCDMPLCSLVWQLSFTLKTDTNGSSKECVPICQTSRSHIPEDSKFWSITVICMVHEYFFFFCMHLQFEFAGRSDWGNSLFSSELWKSAK